MGKCTSAPVAGFAPFVTAHLPLSPLYDIHVVAKTKNIAIATIFHMDRPHALQLEHFARWAYSTAELSQDYLHRQEKHTAAKHALVHTAGAPAQTLFCAE